MLPSKTVFVVGAGASNEAGLPVGDTLKNIIKSKLDLTFEHGVNFVGAGDIRILDVLRRNFGKDINRLLHACWAIRDGVGLSPSIDDFIEIHQHDQDMNTCGKLAIATAILDAEKQSKLSYDTTNTYNTIQFETLDDTWYTGFYQLLSQGVTKKNLASLFSNAVVICFNYDRCIEHYLQHAIVAHYRVSRDEARAIAETLKIFRPYGSVGKYFGPGKEAVPFGSKYLPDLSSITSNLRTYSERVEDEESLNAMRQAIAEAKVLVFLGNAYHATNMALLRSELRSEQKASDLKRVYFTRKGISHEELDRVKWELATVAGLKVNTQFEIPQYYGFTDTCNDLFNTFRLTLRS